MSKLVILHDQQDNGNIALNPELVMYILDYGRYRLIKLDKCNDMSLKISESVEQATMLINKALE
jgi:hypothetical protein